MKGKAIGIVSSAVVVAAFLSAGCTTESRDPPVAGVIAAPEQLSVGQPAPDFPVITSDGEATSFSDILEPTTIVAFVSPPGDQCCWLQPQLVSLAEELKNGRVAVVQISEPTDECPHGPGCIATCNLKDPHLVSLCDAERRAWEAYREPEPGTVMLINYRGKVVYVAPLGRLDTVADKARELVAEFEGWWQSAYEG